MAEGFVFPGRIWFLGPKPPYESIHVLAGVVLTGNHQEGGTGELIPIVYAFSDRDLAERFLKWGGEKAAPYMPLSLPDEQLVEFLEELQTHGTRYLGVDSEPSACWFVPIAGVIERIRQGWSQDPPPGPSA